MDRVLKSSIAYHFETNKKTSNQKAKVLKNEKPMLVVYFQKFKIDYQKQNPLLAVSYAFREKMQCLYEKSLESFSRHCLSVGAIPKRTFYKTCKQLCYACDCCLWNENVAMVSGFFIGLLAY